MKLNKLYSKVKKSKKSETIENKTDKNLINKTKENNTILLTTEKDYFRINKNYKKNTYHFICRGNRFIIIFY